MKLSVVATLYRSAPHIDEFYDRITHAAQSVTSDYEIVLVNDGSPDDSLDRAVRLSEIDEGVIVVDLSRNFGHHKAMMTGLAHARGDHVFLIDCDLEEEPEWLPGFAEQMQRDRCDVVYGIQDRRKGSFFERWSGLWFYRLFRLFAGLELPENMVTARLMTRRYVDALLQFEEREVFLFGLLYITGFAQQPHVVHKHSSSKTTYTLRRKISLAINSITSFSNAPLIAIFYIGALISFTACICIAYLVLHRMLLSKTLLGWTSVMASIWLIGGMIISFIGIVGIYLSKVFSEIKRRPYTIVRQIYGKRRNG
ncbi:MAG TPA: glycosyltransferase family 2 protein [Syntrophobacteraceae bacterium]|nr:glycosyltransferase family 2 protein [Syntrophobacteraceae bacterium]